MGGVLALNLLFSTEYKERYASCYAMRNALPPLLSAVHYRVVAVFTAEVPRGEGRLSYTMSMQSP